MNRDELGDLTVFLEVADHRSFTKAAVRLDISQSAVSHAIRRIEKSIGLKLLNRTSRRVTVTDAGEKLLNALRPGLAQINSRLDELKLLGDVPKGVVRLTASKSVAKDLLWPKLSKIVKDYPDIQIELSLDNGLTDIVQHRFDAGIRLHEYLSPDMQAVKIGPSLRMAVVASPEYVAKHGTPKHPTDLSDHSCIAIRFSIESNIYNWEFEKDGKEITQKITGPFIFNESDLCILAAKEGHGFALVAEPTVETDIREGRLVRVLEDWCSPFEGLYLYYSGHRHVTPALRLIIDRLKYYNT